MESKISSFQTIGECFRFIILIEIKNLKQFKQFLKHKILRCSTRLAMLSLTCHSDTVPRLGIVDQVIVSKETDSLRGLALRDAVRHLLQLHHLSHNENGA